jgi:hypothetical protein
MVRQAKNLTIVLTINTIKQGKNNGLNCDKNRGFYIDFSDFSNIQGANVNHGIQEVSGSIPLISTNKKP